MRPPVLLKQVLDGLPAVVEDLFNIAPHHELVDQAPENAEREPISHHVDHLGPIAVRLEHVCVMP